jgi:hypothetical protein
MALISIKRLILSIDGASLKQFKIYLLWCEFTISQKPTTSINVISTASSFSSK